MSSVPKTLEGPTDTLLHAYLMKEARAQFAQRRSDVEESLASKEAAEARRDLLRETYADLIGHMPEDKVSLEPQVTAVNYFDGYRVENVIYQSRENFHVTANLYVPDGEGPWPGILYVCGHSGNGKAAEAYQRSAILLAENGFVTLVVDPISQGERYQIMNEDGTPATRGGTVEHSFVFILAQLVGTSTVAVEAWDNLRGIDYLVSRPEVDEERIGLTGNSGGGTQTTFLMSLDDRIRVAAPSCYVMTRERLFETIGPQDGCQHLPREGLLGVDHADYITMFAPRPSMILAAEQDFFEFAATETAFAEITSVYSAMGVPEQTRFFSFDDTHGYTRPRRQAMVQWMRKWFYDDDTPVVEAEYELPEEQTLWATETGQVRTALEGELGIHEILHQRAKALIAAGHLLTDGTSRLVSRDAVERLIGLRSDLSPATIEQSETSAYAGTPRAHTRYVLHRPNEVPLPGTLYQPENGASAEETVVLIDDLGRDSERATTAITDHLSKGRLVFAVDLRGYGETADDPEKNTYIAGTQREYRNAMIALHIGRPLLGQRVEDVMIVLDALEGIEATKGKPVVLHAFGEAALVGQHVAFLDDRITSTKVEDSYRSWMHLFAHPIEGHHLGSIVPRALAVYDLPDLAR